MELVVKSSAQLPGHEDLPENDLLVEPDLCSIVSMSKSAVRHSNLLFELPNRGEEDWL